MAKRKPAIDENGDPFAPEAKSQDQSTMMAVPDCPLCSTEKKSVRCNTVRDGLIYRFVCPKPGCRFNIPGPANIQMSREYNLRLSNEHEQHTVRDYQK